MKDELQRISAKTLFFVESIESLLEDSANGKSLSLPTRLKELYGRDIDMDKLQFYPKIILTATPLDGITIPKVTGDQTFVTF